MTDTQIRPETRSILIHDLRHLNGRTPHEIIQIGDDAADEIINLLRASERRVKESSAASRSASFTYPRKNVSGC